MYEKENMEWRVYFDLGGFMDLCRNIGAEAIDDKYSGFLVNIDLKVSDLIDPVDYSWNMDILKELFYLEDIQNIIS